jgi:hypothetical protein
MAKIRRPTAQDYLDVGWKFRAGEVPTRDEFITDMKEQWEREFTEAEKRGPGAGIPGPLNFKHHLQLSLETLKRQVDEIIPGKFEQGLLSKEDAAASVELINILIVYEEQELRFMDMS